MKIKYSDIKTLLEDSHQVIGDINQIVFEGVAPIKEAKETHLVWINPSKPDKQELAKYTKAKFIITDSSLDCHNPELAGKVFIIVKDPKLNYLRIVKNFFDHKPAFGIHPTAWIHPEAEIHPETFIGPFVYIGKSKIDAGSVVHGHCHIYDGVTIGKNVIIHAGCVVGSDGYGYARNDRGELEKFPHIGGVVIEDNVDVGANTCIDRGTLGDTIVREGAKIDNLVHIAHNVVVGRHAAVIANAMIGGSTVIGDYGWVAPSVSLMNGINIGFKSTAGLGAVVTKDIPEGETWAGIPARPLDEFIEIQKKLKKLNG